MFPNHSTNSWNRYRFDKKIRYDSKEIEIFHFLPNIRELHLAQNYLPKDDNILRQMFEHLTNLRKRSYFRKDLDVAMCEMYLHSYKQLRFLYNKVSLID
jgi:hypothetical protein